ncbi:replication protein A1-like protein, partial [Trifolium medium]|nr:replication protein A1-like protein [Trifolium medium]
MVGVIEVVSHATKPPGEKPPYKCDSGHPTEIEIWKYRLEVDVGYENSKTTFTFWDREVAQLLKKSAADLRDESIR